MQRIKIGFVGFTAFIIAVWFLSRGTILAAGGQQAWAAEFTQITGILSIAMMAFSNLLSIRPRWMEPSLDGLDKMYRLHKWLGIGGLGLGVLHWLTASGDGRPPQGTTSLAANPATAAAGALQTWLSQYHGLAHGVGQPALFVLIALVAVALIKVIPYRLFAKTHILVSIAFFLLAFHSVVLMKAAYWSQPIGWLTLALTGIGVGAGLISLYRYFLGGGTAKSTVISAEYYPELRVLETNLHVDQGWPGHKPGQFAFVTTERKEGAHPFTIATDWDAADRNIGFIAKELGDHTATLREQFAHGKPAVIEGPFGNFTFDDDRPRQIWIGAGIGITPFVARMRKLSKEPDDKIVDLYHSTADVSELALSKMRADAAAANVRLHILLSSKDGRLDAPRIFSDVPDWKSASVWFCGPTGFGAGLRKAFVSEGLSARNFHQEIFEMR